MDDCSEVRCPSCEVICPFIDTLVETVCIECYIKASRCQVCSIRLPSQDESMGSLVEKILKEVQELRLKEFRSKREKKIVTVLFEVLQKQMVSFPPVLYVIL